MATGLTAGGPVAITGAIGSIDGTAQLTTIPVAPVSISVTPANA